MPCINNIKLIKKSKHLNLCVLIRSLECWGGDIKKEIGIGWVGYAPGCKKQGIFWGIAKKKNKWWVGG